MGKHFNIGDSVFVAPKTGVYLFSWTTQTYSGKLTETELRVANVVKGTLHIRFASTRVVVCNVNKNDHVWIQTSRSYSEHFLDDANGSPSSFMGVLLFIR